MKRKFIRQRFKLFELATPSGQELLKAKDQTATYIEPGLTYFLGKEWRPRVSIFVANLGTVSKKHEELLTPVEAQFGFGFSPPMEWGALDLSFEFRSMNYEENDLEKIRMGALYHFGSMYLSGGVDSNGASGGIYYSLEKVNAGIMFSTTRFLNQQESFFTQTVYVQLGWQI